MKKYLKYIIIALIVVAAIVAYTQIRKKKNQPEWRTDKATTGSIREVVTATGAINPYLLVDVGTEVSGKIERIYKDFNDTVRKGELLAVLDTEILQANLETAKADLSKSTISSEQAKLDYDLLVELVGKNMAPEYDMKKAEYAYKQAQQNLAAARLTLQRAEKNLNNAYITSPINGVIVARSVDEGQTVAASLNAPTLFKIANNLDQMQIVANVDEADIGKVKVKMPVEFSVDAYPSEKFEGYVKQIRLNPTTEQNVVSYSVIIDAANPDHKLLPGMTTNVTIIIEAKENVLRISETATRFSPSKEVWTLFGLKWEEDLIATARKKAMEALMAKQSSAAVSKADSAAVRPSRPAQLSAGRDSLKTGQPRPAGSGSRPGMAVSSGNMPAFAAVRSGGRGGMASVWVLKDKTPELVMVRTGVSDGAYIEVLDGLAEGMTVLTGVTYKDAKQAANNSALSGPGMRRF